MFDFIVYLYFLKHASFFVHFSLNESQPNTRTFVTLAIFYIYELELKFSPSIEFFSVLYRLRF